MSPQPERPNSHAPFKPKREEIEFPPNVPVQVSIRYNLPKMVSCMSGERAMFTTPDNKVFFLSPEVAGQIEKAGINTREPFTITKQSSGKHGEPVTWKIEKLAHAEAPPQSLGPQSDGTFAIPNDAPRDEDAPPLPARKPPVLARTLVEEANALVDAYATVLERTLKTYQGRIKPDEAKALLITAYIQRGRRVA